MKTKQNNPKTAKMPTKSQQNDNESDYQQLSNEWGMHTNRLNFVEETITKLHKKVLKIQKTLSTLQEFQNQFKEEIGQKIAEMIQVISLKQQNNRQKNNNKKIIETIQSIKQETKRLSKQNITITDKIQTFEQRFLKIEAFTSNLKRDTKDFASEKIEELQKRINHQIKSNISHIYQLLDGFQNKLKDFSIAINKKQCLNPNNKQADKNNFHSQQNKIQKQSPKSLHKNDYFTEPAQDKNGKSQKNQKQENSNQQSKYHLFSKKLEFPSQNNNDIFKRKNSTDYIDNNNVTKNTKKTQTIAVTETNNSRVVYLREKLKQFEDINKKYQINQKQPESIYHRNSLTNQFSSSNFKSSSRDSSNFFKQVSSDSNKDYEKISKLNFLSSQKGSRPQFQPQKLSFEKQKSAKKDILVQNNSSQSGHVSSSISSSRSTFLSNQQMGKFSNREQSAKKIDKLKNIKDYLEQTESQVDESLLDANYN